MFSEVTFNTPLRLVADYHQEFDYRTIPDLAPEDIHPSMLSPAGRTIGVLRVFAEGEVETAYRWDVDVSGITSESDFYATVERECEWLLPTSLKLAADDLVRLHDAGHIVLTDRAAPLEYERLESRMAMAA